MRFNFFWLHHAKNRFLVPATVFAPEGGAPKKIVTLETFTGKILNDESGTNTQPLFVKKIAGKCGKGFTYLIKIGPLFYEMYHRRDVSGGKLLPCKYFRKPISCNFQCHIVEGDNGFYRKLRAEEDHKCQVWGSIISLINQFEKMIFKICCHL